ncbi:WD40 repeat domain-containing protein [uncultured Roseovarius sp.]|uniref:WD40 repeat domain-containing protein n=1 Tax=uncultured Roseovarius sp. TaxID=293344 RepID=UPI0026205289|nr:WD40 repeat domain-containing protein [uncultured Roseovarius sp.]
MVENSSSGLSLFDLLARNWRLDDAVVQTAFNHDETGAVFRVASGKLALASTKDAESPKIRTRMELETGRTTIRPRENPVAPLKTPDLSVRKDLPVIRFGPQGFAAIDKNCALQHVTAGGQIVAKKTDITQQVTSLCSTVTGDMIAIAQRDEITLIPVDDWSSPVKIHLDHEVTCQAFSQDGRTLAAWGASTLSLISLRDLDATPRSIDCAGGVTEISWQKSGAHLACACSDESLCIVDVHGGTSQRVEGFPSPVRNAAFSENGNALVASGAFRLVGWDARDLPQDDAPGTPLTTGKPGFVVLNVIAAHPKRNIVATGYASGLVTLASVGTPQDMMLHQERDTEVSSLYWSKTGEHLAIGFTSGEAAMVTFPSQMFK